MAPPLLLSESSSDEDEKADRIKINKKYASDYQRRKQKQELAAHKDDLESDDEYDSDVSSEDEGGALRSTKHDTSVLKTINAIRNKDATIYNPATRFFDDDSDHDESEEIVTKSVKPKRYKDVVRDQILEKMNKGGSDDSHSDEEDVIDSDRKHRFAYDSEQKDLRQAFLDSVKDQAGEISSDENDDLLVVKRKVKHVQNPEAEKDFAEELAKLEATAGNNEDITDPRGEVKDGEKFLLDYFKKRAWVEDDGQDDSDEDDTAGEESEEDEKLPMKSDPKTTDHDDDEVSLDDLDKADDFESQYNFRFEEAASQSKSGADLSNMAYARGQSMNTLRRKDETRREKRLARKERKAMERQAKEEQLRRLKNAKRQEMQEKIQQIKVVLGDVGEEVDNGAVDEATLLQLLEGDFDPEKFEALMKETYGDSYYEKKETEWKSDKDVRDSLKEDEDGALLVGQDDEAGGLYDEQEEVDEADFQEQDEPDGDVEEEWPSDLEEAEYDPSESALERKVKSKMMDELYKLDYEDIVAGMPTRFKYKKVQPNDFGISTEEILFARDTTLKQFVSLKKLAPYSETGEYTVTGRKRRRFREQAREEIEEILEQHPEHGTAADAKPEEAGKKKRRRKRSKKGDSEEVRNAESGTATTTKVADTKDGLEPKSKRRRRKKKNTDADEVDESKPEGRKLDEKKPVSVIESPTTDTQTAPVTRKEKKAKKHKGGKEKKSKKKKSKGIDGVSDSRLASYGL